MNYTVRMKGKVEEKTSEKDGLKVQDVLDEMELSSETIVSKINGEIVIEDSVIEDGDEVEFIQIIYGG
ncbi:MAG: MoaD/ThiS family protein [Methanobrevibacter sp.]|nr:MoaD/ThiS family protein [Methanobrevibacter sp.]MDO5827325.1 MoaD/ThiS family protein [Methanobrevibacter sp.]MEE0924884.1 MoaD/ThiS family protein [Methanobrevibacter sp.]MEE3443442.1 MoaD/ThiS family protein [Methanobrevibacter sp.]